MKAWVVREGKGMTRNDKLQAIVDMGVDWVHNCPSTYGLSDKRRRCGISRFNTPEILNVVIAGFRHWRKHNGND